MEQLTQRAASDWLTLRRDADTLARKAAAPLLTTLEHHLNARIGSPVTQTFEDPGPNGRHPRATGPAVTVFDLGAGTGANMAWLAPRLHLQQAWTLIDRDEDLLKLVSTVPPASEVVRVNTQVRSITDLKATEIRDPGLLTASAVLDVLSFDQLDQLTRLLDAAQVPALFSLNVTGNVHLTPEAGADDEIAAAFNCHQLRAGLAGPRAADYLKQRLQQAGFRVSTAATPWRLGTQVSPQDAHHLAADELIERYLTERVGRYR